jgi:hypothetical protein
MAPVVRFGLIAAGIGVCVNQVGDLVSDVQLTWGERRVVGIVALITLGSFGLAAWVAGRLLWAAAELIDVIVDQAEATQRAADLIEWHVVPALARMAVALERAASAPRDDGRALALAGARQAIEDGRWDLAERLVKAFARDFPNVAEAATLPQDLAQARQEVVDGLRARVGAARAAGDPDQVIDLRDELTQHLRGEPLKELDRDLIKWLLALIQRRMRTGTVRGDVARLAARMADSFGDTPEGASMRASLPTLRRSAGLCPRCAQPYNGLAEACPTCLRNAAARAGAAAAPPRGTAAEGAS